MRLTISSNGREPRITPLRWGWPVSTRAVLNDENSVLTVSTLLNGEYGLEDIFIGVPAVVNRSGVREVMDLNLSEEERKKLHHSAQVLTQVLKNIL